MHLPKPQLQTPVLFLIFNRLDATKQVFEVIRQAQPPRLYVASDGPRTERPGESEKVQAVKDHVLKNIDWTCEVKTLFRDKNLGCRVAVSSGLDWFFEHEPEGIILEDDCLPNMSFFRYCQDLLTRYRNDTRVMCIAGTNIQENFSSEFSYFFSRFALMWGWASWRRAWSLYDPKILNWPRLRKTKWLYSLGIGDEIFRLYWTQIFDKVYSNEINSWDYSWIYSCWREHGLTILPSINLVQNIGFGNDATHTTGHHPILENLVNKQMNWPLIHPNQIEVIYEADQFISKHWFNVTRVKYLKYLIKSILATFLELHKKCIKNDEGNC